MSLGAGGKTFGNCQIAVSFHYGTMETHTNHPSAYLISVQRHCTVAVSCPRCNALMHQYKPMKLNFHCRACVTLRPTHEEKKRCSELFCVLQSAVSDVSKTQHMTTQVLTASVSFQPAVIRCSVTSIIS